MQFRPFFPILMVSLIFFSFLPPGFSWGFNNLVGNLESFSEMCVLLNNKVSSVGMESYNFFQKKIECLLHSHGLQRLSETVTQSNISSKKKETTQLFKRSWRARALLNLSLTPLLVSLFTPFGESFNPFW